MFVRSVFANYYKLLAGVSLAVMAVALTGCNELAAEKGAPSRPVLVATVHYEAESPARSFVGTIRPRIEADIGFRVPGKVAKRLVEVGQSVDIGQPLATLDEVDLKLQAEQADAELHPTPRWRGRLPPKPAPRICAQKAGPPTRSWIRPGPPPTKPVRGSIAPSARSNSPTTPYPTQRCSPTAAGACPRP